MYVYMYILLPLTAVVNRDLLIYFFAHNALTQRFLKRHVFGRFRNRWSALLDVHLLFLLQVLWLNAGVFGNT